MTCDVLDHQSILSNTPTHSINNTDGDKNFHRTALKIFHLFPTSSVDLILRVFFISHGLNYLGKNERSLSPFLSLSLTNTHTLKEPFQTMAGDIII